MRILPVPDERASEAGERAGDRNDGVWSNCTTEITAVLS
jgi:hypothetical protein